MPLPSTLSFLMPQCLLPTVELTKPWRCFLPRLTAAQTWGNSACAELEVGSSEAPEALQAPIAPGSDPKGWVTPRSGAYGTEKLSVVLSPEQKTASVKKVVCPLVSTIQKERKKGRWRALARSS